MEAQGMVNDEIRAHIEIDDGQIVFRMDNLSITVTADSAIIYRSGSGIPAERVQLNESFWYSAALNEQEKG